MVRQNSVMMEIQSVEMVVQIAVLFKVVTVVQATVQEILLAFAYI